MIEVDALRYSRFKWVTLLGAFINLTLGTLKVAVGWVAQSHALLADGIHSWADLSTDILLIVAARYSHQEADDDHPYGHQRIETAATLLLALFLMVTGGAIAYDAVIHMMRHVVHYRGQYVIQVALLSVLLNEGLFHITRYYAKRCESKLLQANAWHHRSDAASSLIVLIGAVGAYFGYLSLDNYAAILVGVMIVKMGWSLGWSSVRELVDTGLEPEAVNNIRGIILNIPGVLAIHQLRTRLMGHVILVDVHALVAPKISVSEGHYIAQQIHFTLMKQVNNIRDVTVHIDPEDDEVYTPNLKLPSRDIVLEVLKNKWCDQSIYPYIESIVLHYLAGKIYLDLHIPKEACDQDEPKRLQQALTQAIAEYDDIAGVSVLLKA